MNVVHLGRFLFFFLIFVAFSEVYAAKSKFGLKKEPKQQKPRTVSRIKVNEDPGPSRDTDLSALPKRDLYNSGRFLFSREGSPVPPIMNSKTMLRLDLEESDGFSSGSEEISSPRISEALSSRSSSRRSESFTSPASSRDSLTQHYACMPSVPPALTSSGGAIFRPQCEYDFYQKAYRQRKRRIIESGTVNTKTPWDDFLHDFSDAFQKEAQVDTVIFPSVCDVGNEELEALVLASLQSHSRDAITGIGISKKSQISDTFIRVLVVFENLKHLSLIGATLSQETLETLFAPRLDWTETSPPSSSMRYLKNLSTLDLSFLRFKTSDEDFKEQVAKLLKILSAQKKLKELNISYLYGLETQKNPEDPVRLNGMLRAFLTLPVFHSINLEGWPLDETVFELFFSNSRWMHVLIGPVTIRPDFFSPDQPLQGFFRCLSLKNPTCPDGQPWGDTPSLLRLIRAAPQMKLLRFLSDNPRVSSDEIERMSKRFCQILTTETRPEENSP